MINCLFHAWLMGDEVSVYICGLKSPHHAGVLGVGKLEGPIQVDVH